MFWYNNTLVELDLVQHQISFAGSSDVRLSFASPSITCPGKTNLMLDSVFNVEQGSKLPKLDHFDPSS